MPIQMMQSILIFSMVNHLDFYVPSLSPNWQLFLQKIITLALLLTIFTFGVALSPSEIITFANKMGQTINGFLGICIECCVFLS